MSFFEGRMFSSWIVTNITFARGTLHCLQDSHFFRGLARDLWTVAQRLLICGSVVLEMTLSAS
jgi:hypothetical protein